MAFCSFTFLLFFMPAVLLGYRFLPDRAKRPFLFCASLVFYGWGMPAWLILLLLVGLAGLITIPIVYLLFLRNGKKEDDGDQTSSGGNDSDSGET